MATIRIGDWGDQHYGNESLTAYRDDFDHILNTLGCDITLMGGDVTAGGLQVPHTPEQQVRGWFENVCEQVTGGLDESIHYIPGNHEVPYQWFKTIASEYINPEQLVTPKVLKPIDGLSIIMMNTQGPGNKSGGAQGIGKDNCYVPRHELRWVREKLIEANNNGDMIILYGHSPLFPSNVDSNIAAYREKAVSNFKDEEYLHDEASYWIPLNHTDVWDYIGEIGSEFVYVSHHDYHAGFEGAEKVGGKLHHIWQDHYAGAGSSSPNTFGYLDVDTSSGSVQYVSVESSDKSETTVMDITI